MKKKNIWKRMSGWLRGFLILAVAFLALGLGTLGSTVSTGKGYVLPCKQSGDEKDPCILLQVYAPEELKDKRLAVTSVYFNLGAIYAESGKVATIRLARGTTTSSGFYNYADVSFENFYEEIPEGKESVGPQKNALYNWAEYSVTENTTSGTGWLLTTYPYYKLTSLTCDVLVNEIAFVAREADTDGKIIGEKSYALNASVYYNESGSGTLLPPANGESYADAADHANAIVDTPCVPSAAQSSFVRYSQEEIYTLMTINEMRQGDNLSTGIYRYLHDGRTYYLADTVYNSLGTDLVALGVGMFGMSPFGLRFMPFLASFGVLVFGYLFVRKLAGSDKAGFAFALVYTLSGAGFSLGHLGTPLMIGLFFFMAALYFTMRFFKDGMKKPNFLSAVPALLGGLFAAGAICVNGAYVIPTLFLVGLFAAGAVRGYRKTRAALDEAIDEVETYENAPHPSGEGVSEPRKKLGAALNAHRICTALPAAVFFAFLIVGTFLISMLSYLPLHQTYVRLYDDPLNPTKNVFYFLWRAFAGGFAGENFLTQQHSVWAFFYVIFRGSGETAAVTATGSLVAIAALVAGVIGAILSLIRLARSADAEKLGSGRSFGTELAQTMILMLGFVVSLVTAAFAQGGFGFMLLAYLFLFAFAGRAASFEEEGVLGTVVKALAWGCLAALIAVFAVFAVATFSIPTSGFLWNLAG